jgi:hypothetical protein
MYMPHVTIYVSRELREQLRDHDLPVSEVCQQALWDALTADGHRRPGDPLPGYPSNHNQEAHK